MSLTRDTIDFKFENLKIGRLIFIINFIGYRKECTMKDIRNYLNVQASTATRQVDKLVNELALVNRITSEDDRRNVILTLTEKGWKVYKHHKQIQEKLVHSFMGKFSPEEIQLIKKIILELTKNDGIIPSK